MNANDYKAGVLSTESAPASLQINETTLHAMLTLAAGAAAILDQTKRQLFYGNKGMNVDKLSAAVDAVGNMSNFLAAQLEFDASQMSRPVATESELDALPEEIRGIRLENLDIRKLHAALGLFTESGELLELLTAQFEGKGLDNVGFVEELGDSDWYLTMGTDAAGVSEEVRRRINNQKLTDKRAGRYKKGAFTVADAIERNTADERKLLEGQDA